MFALPVCGYADDFSLMFALRFFGLVILEQPPTLFLARNGHGDFNYCGKTKGV